MYIKPIEKKLKILWDYKKDKSSKMDTVTDFTVLRKAPSTNF